MKNTNENKQESCLERLISKYKNEFRLENFSLSFEKNSEFMKNDPEEVLEYFHSSIWPCFGSSLIYVVYRIFIAIYYTIWFVESIVRNYEFRAQNFYISNKKKQNLLLLHPWPVYMTSWSLTILFIHLWISAIIVLYFYSIDQKSLLARVFTFLFGPFSCSRVDSRANFKIIQSQENPIEESRIHFISKNKKYSKDNKNEQQLSIISNKINENENKLKDQESLKPIDESIQLERVSSTKKTYCDNKLNCHLPSSSVTCDSATWKLWIDAHVPVVILVLIKISWLLYNLIVISAIFVTTGYFTYVFIMDIETEPTWIAEIGNLHRHGFNSIVAIIDIIVLAYPVKVLHFIYTSLYGWCYALVTLIYWSQDPKKNIVYEQIDYNRPFLILTYYFLLTILTFVMQSFHYFAYQVKIYLKEKYLLVKKSCFSSDSGL